MDSAFGDRAHLLRGLWSCELGVWPAGNRRRRSWTHSDSPAKPLRPACPIPQRVGQHRQQGGHYGHAVVVEDARAGRNSRVG